jgi:transcriptional regulator with XRE-family HTH domain
MGNSASVTYPYVLNRLFAAHCQIAGKKDKQVAEELGLARSDFSKYKNGKHRMSADLLWQYAQNCGISGSSFLRQADSLRKELISSGIEVKGGSTSRLSAEEEAKMVKVAWGLTSAYWHASKTKLTESGVLQKVLEVNRLRLGYTSAKVSELSGISSALWSRVVNNDIGITVDLLCKVSGALNLSVLDMYRQTEGVFAFLRGDPYSLGEGMSPSGPLKKHEESVLCLALSLCLMDAMRADAKSD